MGGRSEETTNAWDPNEGSQAQQTAESKRPDIYRMHPLARRGLDYLDEGERREIHEHVYKGCRWIDLDAIEAEAAEIIETDPANAERFYGNRPVAGSGAAFNMDLWDALVRERYVPPRNALITIGVDGARHDDALAIVGCEVKTGYMWPLAIIERPDNAPDNYTHDKKIADDAIKNAFETWQVWRLYADPQYLDGLIAVWSNQYGDKRVVEWLTYRWRAIAWAVREFQEAIGRRELSHSADETLDSHVANARRKTLTTVRDDEERFMHTLAKDGAMSPRKIDGAMAAVLAWKARTDCIALGGEWMGDMPAAPPVVVEERWVPGMALPAAAMGGGGQQGGPMGSLS
jgi:hypothetical protein